MTAKHTGTVNCGRVKLADNNDGNDAAFEQAFSNLAHAYLKDRAPGLLDYEVGFQLVDRNDDDTKAIGIMGFKVNSQWLYGPVFFVNGDLKGHELLYLKGQDAFRPLKETWVNYLIGKKPTVLGNGTDRNTRNLGVNYPDLFRALQSPHKYAAAKITDEERLAMAAAAAPFQEKFASVGIRPLRPWAALGLAAMVKHAVDKSMPTDGLLETLRLGGVRAVQALGATFAEYPRLKTAFDRFYDGDAVKEVIAHVQATPSGIHVHRERPAVHAGSVLDHLDKMARDKVEFHIFEGVTKSASVLLDDDDRSRLMIDGVLIKDAREDSEVSTAYAVPTRIEFQQKLTTPTQSGIYDVLSRDGTYDKCLILLHPIGPCKSNPWATVIRLTDGKRDWLSTHPSYIYVDKQYGDWADWFENLPDAASLSDDTHYIVLGADGTATLPFRVVADTGTDEGGGECYDVWFDTRCDKASPAGSSEDNLVIGFSRYCGGRKLRLGQKATKFRAHEGTVYTPAGAKMLKLSAPNADDADQSESRPIQLGDALDLQSLLYNKFAMMHLRSDCGSVTVDDSPMMPAVYALRELVQGRGFRETAAHEMLKLADSATGPVAFAVKYADEYSGRGAPYLTAGTPSAPSMADPMFGIDDILGSGVGAQHQLEQSAPVTDLQADPGDRSAYQLATPDPMATQTAQNAADSGQKTVFDTAMISNLLKMTRDDKLVDEEIKPLLAGLDAIGRLLMRFYWHGDRFAERFGADELPDIEDSLRNTFDDLGDVTLFFVQKTVDADPGESATDIDLGDSGE